MPRSVSWLTRSLAVAAGCVAFCWMCVMPFRCNRAVLALRASLRPLPAMGELRAATIADRNSRYLADACLHCPPNVAIHLVLAENAELVGRPEDVVRELDAAIAVQPRPEIYADRGRTKLELNHLDDAVADFATAARFDEGYIDDLDPVLRSRILAQMNAR